jgi:hypothetical protein
MLDLTPVTIEKGKRIAVAQPAPHPVYAPMSQPKAQPMTQTVTTPEAKMPVTRVVYNVDPPKKNVSKGCGCGGH